MKRSADLIRVLLFFGSVAGAAAPVVAAPAGDVIARARAYLGGEAALSAVHAVHFVGTIESQKVTATGTVPQKASIEIIFQKPCQQRIVVTGAETVETTGLDGYDAWQREQSLTDPKRWNMSVLGPELIKWLRATTWENLNFYKGVAELGGTIEVVGETTLDGHPAVKVALAHDAAIVFTYYFDPATGRLLMTETKDRETREEGEILAGGVRFPQKEIQTVKSVDAKGRPLERKLVITFDKVTINETFPESDFEAPMLPPPNPAPAAISVPDLKSAAGPATVPAGVK